MHQIQCEVSARNVFLLSDDGLKNANGGNRLCVIRTKQLIGY